MTRSHLRTGLRGILRQNIHSSIASYNELSDATCEIYQQTNQLENKNSKSEGVSWLSAVSS